MNKETYDDRLSWYFYSAIFLGLITGLLFILRSDKNSFVVAAAYLLIVLVLFIVGVILLDVRSRMIPGEMATQVSCQEVHDLAHDVVHKLKNDLTAIFGLFQLLERTKDSAKRAQHIERGIVLARELDTRINQIRDDFDRLVKAKK